MALLEILLFGALLVPIYLLSDAVTLWVERRVGHPLGAWRSVVFFLLFLCQLLLAMHLVSLMFGGASRGGAT